MLNMEALENERFDELDPKHKVFLSHSGAKKEQKDFVEQLCVDLEAWRIYPFFDKRWSSLPIGVKFANLIFKAIEQCQVGVLVLSDEFFSRTKWPMLELVAMVRETKKRDIKIIPVLFFMSWDEWLKKENHESWIRKWAEWAKEDKRIDIGEWKEALRALKGINSMVRDNTSAVTCRKEIVDVIQGYVLPETRWDDSQIEGRMRLCKDLTRKIDEREVRDGIRVMGLHGMGGMGKTSLCKAMCNEYVQKLKGRVCHIEMKSASEVELLREVLKRLTNTRADMLDKLNIDECRDHLKRCLQSEAVFLAVDNVSDSLEVIRQAKTFLGVKWATGSVILVTARSLGELVRLRPHIREDECVEMLELEEGEAKALFLKHAGFEEGSATGLDQEVVKRCVKRCYFSKGEGKGSHYIPLALQVLGELLGFMGYDAKAWDARLKKIHDTFENEMSGEQHPIFSILRTSYDCLSDEAKLLFMDVAIHVSWQKSTSSHRGTWNYCEWLGVVHEISVEEVMRRLNGLKQKSLLEETGEGLRSIVMHDLWLEFCMAETKAGKLGDRWCVYLEESRELGGSTPICGFWENVRRMCLVREGWRSLHGVQLSAFANVTVLRVQIDGTIVVPSDLDLDISKLTHLKSLELRTYQFFSKIVGLGSLTGLVYLSWIRERASNSACIEEIGQLSKLEALELEGFTNADMPDLRMLTSLREVWLRRISNAVTVRALSSTLSKLGVWDCKMLKSLASSGPKLCALKVIEIGSCGSLGEMPDLSNFPQLEELQLWDCQMLKSLASSGRKLCALKVIKIRRCGSLGEMPDLSNFLQLEELELWYCEMLKSLASSGPKLCALKVIKIGGCGSLGEMPDLSNFLQLEELELWDCEMLKSLASSGPKLCALKVIKIGGCGSLGEMPDLSNFPQLEELNLKYCESLKSLASSGPKLCALKVIKIRRCGSLGEMPDLSNFPQLEELELFACQMLKSLASSGPKLCALKVIKIGSCGSLGEMPDLSNFPQLEELQLWDCQMLKSLASSGRKLCALKVIKIRRCGSLGEMPDLSNFLQLEELELWYCEMLKSLASSGPKLCALKVIKIGGCGSLGEMPDLSNFLQLEELELWDCEMLKSLASSGPKLCALKVIKIGGCGSLGEMPDLSNFPQLEELNLKYCESLKSLASSGPKLCALKVIKIRRCGSLGEMPDLSNFPQLEELNLKYCESLKSLASSGPKLCALKVIKIGGCGSLGEMPDLSNFPQLEELNLKYCESLKSLASSGPKLCALKLIKIGGCGSLGEMPDLSNFPQLEGLELWVCEMLMSLASSGPMLFALKVIDIWNCGSLGEMPDLSNFPQLNLLDLRYCKSLKSLTSSGPKLCSLKVITIEFCNSLEEMPDLGNFPQLEELHLNNCVALMSLMSSAPLYALRFLELMRCCRLTALPKHLNSSESLEELRLAGTGIDLSEEDFRNLKVSCRGLRVSAVFVDDPIEVLGKDYLLAKEENACSESGTACALEMDTSDEELQDMDTCDEERQDMDNSDEELQDVGEINVELGDVELHSCKQFLVKRLSNSVPDVKVTRVGYNSSGDSLVALTSKGMRKAGAKISWQLRRAGNGSSMMDETLDSQLPEGVVSCMPISEEKRWLISASGGRVSLCDMSTFKMIAMDFHPPLETATSVAFVSQDNGIFVVGMEDSTIRIFISERRYGVQVWVWLRWRLQLKGHHKRITSLAFSDLLSVLVSSGADGQLCMWRSDWWPDLFEDDERLEVPVIAVLNEPERSASCEGVMRVEFHKDQRQLLVVGESQLAVYDGSNLERLVEWAAESPFTAAITDATFSCDGEFVYAGFGDGGVGVFDGRSLSPRCRLAQPFYTPRGMSGARAYPVAVAANPVECRQFALCMSDGGVLVVEPVDSDGEWRPGSPPGSGAVSRQSYRMVYCCDQKQL